MKNAFSVHYSFDENDFKQLWNECLFVFDANVLLNLYRYTINTKNAFLNVIESLSNRIFIPHQAALEFHSNRVKVILEQVEAYQHTKRTLSNVKDSINNQIDKELKGYSQKHPIIDIQSVKDNIFESLNLLIDELEEQEKEHPNYLNNDTIRTFLDEHIKSIGSPYTQEILAEIYKEGESRYKIKRPPGYEDVDKKDGRKYYQGLVIESKYADLIVWKQAMDEAKLKQKPVIFITDDQKDDWWKREFGKTIGPRPELLDEFLFTTQQKFHMYGSHQFLEYALMFLQQSVDDEAVKEVRELYMFNDSEQEKNKFNETNLIFVRDAKNRRGYYRRKNENLLELRPDGEFNTGDKVYHQSYGEGEVVLSLDNSVVLHFPDTSGLLRFKMPDQHLIKLPKNTQ